METTNSDNWFQVSNWVEPNVLDRDYSTKLVSAAKRLRDRGVNDTVIEGALGLRLEDRQV